MVVIIFLSWHVIHMIELWVSLGEKLEYMKLWRDQMSLVIRFLSEN